jgi:hypothetical protein
MNTTTTATIGITEYDTLINCASLDVYIPIFFFQGIISLKSDEHERNMRVVLRIGYGTHGIGIDTHSIHHTTYNWYCKPRSFVV